MRSNLNLAQYNDRIIMNKMIISHSYVTCSLLKNIFIDSTATMLIVSLTARENGISWPLKQGKDNEQIIVLIQATISIFPNNNFP